MESMSAVLRVGGANLDVDRCLEWLPQDKLEHIWRVGEERRKGEYRTTSGFNLLLAEADNSKALFEEKVVRQAQACYGAAKKEEQLIGDFPPWYGAPPRPASSADAPR